MSTRKEIIDFILRRLAPSGQFAARPMFGEYALYAAGTVVALICDDRLYVKMAPAANELEDQCEKGAPYPGAKPHYIVDEGQLSTLHNLPTVLFAIADSIPKRNKKRVRKRN